MDFFPSGRFYLVDHFTVDIFFPPVNLFFRGRYLPWTFFLNSTYLPYVTILEWSEVEWFNFKVIQGHVLLVHKQS